MTCTACEKRQAQEQRQLSDCEGRCKDMSVKNQRLSLALAVVGTLVGKESLDFALGLSSTLGPIAAATTDNSMDIAEVQVAVVQEQETDRGDWGSGPVSSVAASDPLFPELPALTPMLGVPERWDSMEMVLPGFEAPVGGVAVPTSGLGLLFLMAAVRPRRRR